MRKTYKAYLQGDNSEIPLEVTECDPKQSTVDMCIHMDQTLITRIQSENKDWWVRVVKE